MLLGFGATAQQYQKLKDGNHPDIYQGFITDSILKADTTYKWFGDAQKVYKPKDAVVKTISQNKNDVNFIVFMGTWCEDSHFVVPRFFKILDEAGYDKNKLTLVGVDRSKKELTHLATALNADRVPTIIAFKSGKELGRVVEYGTTGKFDEELVQIIAPKK